jgi:hypothetical protein
VSGAYNYERFDAYVESGEDEREFGAFPNLLHAGERAPDGELLQLDWLEAPAAEPPTPGRTPDRLRRSRGERVRLSELWRRNGVVLEFGSFT